MEDILRDHLIVISFLTTWQWGTLLIHRDGTNDNDSLYVAKEVLARLMVNILNIEKEITINTFKAKQRLEDLKKLRKDTDELLKKVKGG